MGYAVEMLIRDREAQPIREAFARIGSALPGMGATPHVSLAVFDTVDADTLIAVTARFAAHVTPFQLHFSSFGLFPGVENVLFLAPVVTDALLRIHAEFHQRLADQGLRSDARYQPGSWVPHCTLNVEIPMDQCLESLRKLYNQPLLGHYTVDTIHVVEFRPAISLGSWTLTGPSSQQL